MKVKRSYVLEKFGPPKSGKSGVIPLPAQLKEVLQRYRHLKSELVFCREDGSPLSRDVIKHPFWATIKRAGLRRIKIHKMRDSFASQLVVEGGSLKEVQELLGHSDIRITMKYAHISPGYLKEAVAILDDLNKGSTTEIFNTQFGQILTKSQKISARKGAKYLKLIKNQ